MAIGLPSFQSIIASTRLTSAANAMVSALQLAKMEAIKQQKTVFVIKKTTWEKGWDVFVDSDGNGLQDSTELTLATFDALSSTITVPVGTGKTTSSYSTSVKYKSTGRFGSPNGHFLFCSVAAKDFRWVATEPSGRIHVETASNSTTTYATSGC
jgi:type IV fimbrial biogenesis protein FimT